jgi:uncharacterized protein (DUF58 family)
MTETHRWRGVIALSLAAGAVGLAVDRPSMLLLAVVARDLSGARETETTVAADTELDCTGTETEGPLRDRTLDQVGRIVAQNGGSGIEFHRTREYRAGDAMHRIDWNRYARTGSLTTVEYREENAATVVLLVDARQVAYSVSAAEQLLASLPPTEEEDHEEQVEQLRMRLPSAAQVVLLSPLSDQAIVETARRLDAYGLQMSVISPDVTADESVGQRLAGVERDNRLSELRKAGIPVVEWDPETPLAAALLNRPRRVRA